MFKKTSGRGKYLLAALVGVAAGGVIVALTTRAVPKIVSEMEAKCKRMMADIMPELKEGNCEAEGMCQRVMASGGQTPEHATCHS